MSQYAVPTQKIKVLIIESSALVRRILKQVINSYPDMEAVGGGRKPGAGTGHVYGTQA